MVVRKNVRPQLLGPEMAAPILWAPGVLGLFLQESLHPHKIVVLGGGGIFFGLGYFGFFFGGGGGKCQFYFYGRGDFPDYRERKISPKFSCVEFF